MDERKGPTWHCIVGRNFGSFVTHGTLRAGIYLYTHFPTSRFPKSISAEQSDQLANHMTSTETKHFIYFYLGHCAILLFKTQ
jgi:dynein light chain LC8-type